MENEIIRIDREKCVGCGACVSDCVAKHIELCEGIARVKDNGCIECGHCYAICPTEAISMKGYDTEDCQELYSLENYDSDKLLLAMKSRRSIRRFTDEPVTEEELARILEAGRYCPTGSNAQNVHFLVLRDCLDEAEEEAVQTLSRAMDRGAGSGVARARKIEKGFFFCGAKLVIVTAAKRDVDAALASSYMELMAESMGLGVLYNGYFCFAAKHSKKLKEIIGMPEGKNAVTCMVFGRPDVSYKRLTPRKKANVIFR